MFLKKFIFCLVLASNVASALIVSDREALDLEIAAMDFMDPSVSVLEMKQKLVSRMPVPHYVINETVLEFSAGEKQRFRSLAKKGHYEQQIFSGVEPRENEARKHKKFQKWLKDKKLTLPVGLQDGPDMMRMLQSRMFKFQQAYDAIVTFDRDHRVRLLPLLRDFEKHLHLLDFGFYYAYGRDSAQRPIIYFDGRKWLDSGVSLQDMLSTIDLVHCYLLGNAMVAGQIEVYHVIVDMANISLAETPITSFATISNHMRNGYFVRSSTLNFVNVPFIVQMASKFIYNFLTEVQAASVFFFLEEYGPTFEKNIGTENLQVKFGGKLPEKTQDYFPPHLNFDLKALPVGDKKTEEAKTREETPVEL